MTHGSAHGLTPEPARTWLADALCARDEYRDQRDLWFANKKDAQLVRQARQICWDCPVIQACGQWAVENREGFGMWGGVAEGERRALLRRRGIRIKDTDPDDEQADTPPKQRTKAAA